jgi:hypothetical protein
VVSPGGKRFSLPTTAALLTSRWKNAPATKSSAKAAQSGHGLRDIYKIDISALDSDSSFHRRNKTGIM